MIGGSQIPSPDMRAMHNVQRVGLDAPSSDSGCIQQSVPGYILGNRSK